MKQELQLIEILLPADIRNVGIYYDPNQNRFTTLRYYSNAGNVYFKAARFSENICIVQGIGIGHTHAFLNSIDIYTNKNGVMKKIISKAYHCKIYSRVSIKAEARKLLSEKMLCDAKRDKITFDEDWLDNFIKNLVEDTYKNQIETLKRLNSKDAN